MANNILDAFEDDSLIQLVSNDGKKFTVNLKSVNKSSVILGLIANANTVGSLTPLEIHLPNVASNELQKIIDFLENHKNDTIDPSEWQKKLKQNNVSDFDKNLVEMVDSSVLELMTTAVDLNIQPLVDICAWKIAQDVKQTSISKTVYNHTNPECCEGPHLIESTWDIKILDYTYRVSISAVSPTTKEMVLKIVNISMFKSEDDIKLTVDVKHFDKEVHTETYELDNAPNKVKMFPIDLSHVDIKTDIFDQLNVFVTLRMEPSFISEHWGTEHGFEAEDIPHDCSIKIGDRKFYVFKQILALHSKVFDKQMFGDVENKDKTEFELHGADPDVFSNLLNLIYPSRLILIEDFNCMQLMEMAIQLKMPSMISRCATYLCNFNKCANVSLMDRLELADKNNINHLKIACLMKIRNMSTAIRRKFKADETGRLNNLKPATYRNIF